MIIPEYNAIFVHIPKTAGQSIENLLLQTLGKNREQNGAQYVLKKNLNPKLGPKRLAHLTATQYADLGYLGDSEITNYYSFSFVRNPWSRVVSFYKYSGFSALVSFKSFVLYYLPALIKSAHWFYRPQHEFVCNAKGEVIVNFLGRFESLHSDFQMVAKTLSVSFNELPQDNVSINPALFSKKSMQLLMTYPSILSKISLGNTRHNRYQEYYCDATRNIVNDMYSADISLFNYNFDNVQP